MAEVTTTRQPSSSTESCPQKALLWLGQATEKKSGGKNRVLSRPPRSTKACREPGFLVRNLQGLQENLSGSESCTQHPWFVRRPLAHPPSHPS